jgi:transglutaminase-like putative cysteine protease
MSGSTGAILMNGHFKLHKNVLIFLLSAIGLIVLPHAYNLPIVLFGFFYLLLAWRFLGIWKHNWLPSKLILSLLTVCGLALLYSQHQGLLGRDAGTSLFVTALGLKLLEIKSERDIYLINFLAFIVAASQFLYQQSILMAVYILFVCCVLLATLFCINSRNHQTVPALKYASILILQAIPISIVLFILFPRVEAPHWMLFDNHRAKSGLSDVMEPGSISDLALSAELVFRVRFTGSLPPNQQRYWRGAVLSYTDGKRWTQTVNSTKPNLSEAPKFTGESYQYTLLMEPQNKNWVFAMELAADFASPLHQNASYQLVTTSDPDKRAEYKVTSYPNYNTGAPSPKEFKDAMQLPGDASDTIKQLISRLHGFDSAPEIFIGQLLNHFKTENFHYTLTPPLSEDNPIESFLFESKKGFCSHYASAFVYLMRVAQIPARVVIGFQGGELNPVGNFLEVRQSDAHAWAEVWLQNRGWVRFDPTAAIAPERIDQTINPDQLVPGELIRYLSVGTHAQGALNWLKQARQLWSNVDYNWQRWVINYDNKNQARFLSALGVHDIKTMIYWMAGSISLIIAVIAWALLYQKQKTTDRVLLIYQRFCKKIARLDLNISTGEGPKDFAERIKIKLPGHSQDIDQITKAFINLRYGKNPAPGDLNLFSNLVSKFKI